MADDLIIQMITDRCSSFESISLRDCNCISAAALLKLIRTCKHLKLVDFKSCFAVSASVIEEMGQSCPCLVGLNLGRLKVTDEMGAAIGISMPKLKWLNLNRVTISSGVLCSILDSCTELEYVSVQWAQGLVMHHELENRASRIADFKYCFWYPYDLLDIFSV